MPVTAARIACAAAAAFLVAVGPARAGDPEPTDAPPGDPLPPSDTPEAPADPPAVTAGEPGADVDGAPAVGRSAADAAVPDALDVRLTLSSFLYREAGASGPPLVDMGAAIEGASPVRRYFGDLRAEITDAGFALDARVRQTTSQRYQAGAGAGAEYEVRTLRYRLGSGRTALVVGRQLVDVIGATRIDGAAITRRLTAAWSATACAGAFPQLGSRSIDTDYPAIRNADGSMGSRLVPIAGGAGATYAKPNLHGDLGVGAVYVPQAVPGATAAEASRVFVATSGYGRPARWLDLYQFGLVDVVGANGVDVTNASLGLNVHPVATVQVSASVNHVSTDILQIAARNVLVDPDPTAIGIVQNNIELIRVSQDMVRVGTSVALARSRFEVSLSGGLLRRPAVAVALADGTGSVAFPEARSGNVTLVVLDRNSIGGLRASVSGTVTFPIGDDVPNRSRGAVVRVVGGRMFRDGRGQIEADVAVQRFRDGSGGGACTDSLDVFACYGASTTAAAQAGALASWRIGREWLLLLDTHVGVLRVESSTMAGRIEWPAVYSVTGFARIQWRYR